MKRMILFAAALCLLTISCTTVETVETTVETVEIVDGNLTVQGACGMCKTRIEEAALGVNGVTMAEWDMDAKELTLQFDSGRTSLDDISKALAAVGHDTDRDMADDEVYAALNECCLYR